MNKESGLIFLDAPGGTGKTFVINLIVKKLTLLQKIVIATASSGIAATLILRGQTVHNAFKVPIKLLQNE